MRRVVAIALMSTLMLQVAPLLASPAMGKPTTGQSVENGIITGTAESTTGQTLPGYTVQVRNLETGQIVSSTTSDAAGGFSFSGLTPANYIVEIVSETGAIVGSSAPIAVVSGTTVAVTVSATAATMAGPAGAGIGTLLAVTAVAAAAGIAGVVVVARDDASPSQ